MNVGVKDLSELAERLNALAEDYPAQMAAGLFQEASAIMNESKRQCPVRYGYLRGSGYVTDPFEGYGAVRISLGYSAEYAIYVHENLQAFHPVGKAKFLEDPLMAAITGFSNRVVDRIDKIILGGM